MSDHFRVGWALRNIWWSQFQTPCFNRLSWLWVCLATAWVLPESGNSLFLKQLILLKDSNYESLPIFLLLFFHSLYTGYLLGLQWRLRKIMLGKCFAESLVHNKSLTKVTICSFHFPSTQFSSIDILFIMRVLVKSHILPEVLSDLTPGWLYSLLPSP